MSTFVKNGHTGDVRGINWKFNAWGGDYDGLYKNWEKDDKAALQFCNMTGYDCYDANCLCLREVLYTVMVKVGYSN